MNGAEYERLFKMAEEGRDAALSCERILGEHGKRLDTLEGKVGDNATAVAVGRFGLRAIVVLGSFLIGVGGFLFGLWDRIGGGSGPH